MPVIQWTEYPVDYANKYTRIHITLNKESVKQALYMLKLQAFHLPFLNKRYWLKQTFIKFYENNLFFYDNN